MFDTLFVTPLYNGFIGLLDILPGADAGFGIIIFTVLVSAALYPISKKSLLTQARMKQFEGDLNALKERYANNKEEQARQLIAFYREKGINPFSNLALLFIQLPIIIALYFVFTKTSLPAIDPLKLYSFIPVPDAVNMHFLGLVDISQKSLFLAALAAVAQFVQGWFSPAFAAKPQPPADSTKPSFEHSLATAMRFQVRYFLPGIIFLISYQYSGTIALYFATRSAFMFAQELVMRRHFPKKQ